MARQSQWKQNEIVDPDPNVIAHQDATGEILEVGDEGLERFSYYSIKHEFLDQPSKQVVANATLSETVALFIGSWSRMTPRQKAWLSSWLQSGIEKWD